MERKRNLAEIRRLLHEKRATHSPNAFFRFLYAKGIHKTIAEEIFLEFSHHHEEIASLCHILARRIRVWKSPDFTHQKIFAVVGSSGSGKTTAVLKLARFYAKNKRVGLFTLEKEKLKEQILKCYLRSLNGILYIEKEESLKECDVVIVDTPGCAFTQSDKIDQIGEMLAKIPQSEILLTLSLSSKEEDLFGSIHQFSALRPAGLLLTKMDETLTSAKLINLLAKTELAVYFVSYGNFFEGEMQVANASQITHRILSDYNEEKYHLIRQMVLDS